MQSKQTPEDFWQHMDEYAKHFGWIAMRWSHLERNMCALLEKLAGTSRETAEAIYLPLNADARKNLLLALTDLNVTNEILNLRIKKFLTEFDELRIQRNRFMHCAVAWVDPKDGVMRQHRDSQRGQLKKVIDEVPIEMVWKLSRDLNGLQNSVLADICYNDDFAEAFEKILNLKQAGK
jgi:hypothetical protein